MFDEISTRPWGIGTIGEKCVILERDALTGGLVERIEGSRAWQLHFKMFGIWQEFADLWENRASSAVEVQKIKYVSIVTSLRCVFHYLC